MTEKLLTGTLSLNTTNQPLLDEKSLRTHVLMVVEKTKVSVSQYYNVLCLAPLPVPIQEPW